MAGPKAEGVYTDHLLREVHETIEPVLTGMGYALVELAVGRRKGVSHIAVVIYRAAGVGVDDCAEVSGMILPRLETMEQLTSGVTLEVSSPGIERSIRSPAEYGIFAGRGVRLLAGTETEWQSGIIDHVEGDTLWLRKGRNTRGFALGGIRKARLDHAVEVEEEKNAV
jgi:ribosome maturation factor RimP